LHDTKLNEKKGKIKDLKVNEGTRLFAAVNLKLINFFFEVKGEHN